MPVIVEGGRPERYSDKYGGIDDFNAIMTVKRSGLTLAEVLQLLDVQEQSGVLTVERSGARVDIYFRRGRVDQAIADGVPDEFLLRRFVTAAELLTRARAGRLLASRPPPPGRRQGRAASRRPPASARP